MGRSPDMSFMVRIEPTGQLPREIFLLGGQSNMSGRGVLSQVPSFFYASKVKLYTNAGFWTAGYEPTDDPTGQVDSVSLDGPVGVGASPGMAFGNELYRFRPFREIGLVPCARGDTSIAQWAAGSLSRSTLYGSMVARGLEAAPAGVLKGLVWDQGHNEGQGSDEAAAEGWADSFLAIYDALCEDLEIPDFKVVVAVMADTTGDWPLFETVRDQQRSLDGARGGNIGTVELGALPGKPGDPDHLTTASLVEAGKRYAAKMAELLA